MSSTMNVGRVLCLGAGLLLCATLPASAGFYKTISSDGDFSDWADVPVYSSTSVNSGVPIDLASVKLANDATNLYILLTFATPVNPQSGAGTFIGIDSDNNASTGFSIFGNPIGSNAGFQNDFPFTQTAASFNSGGTVAGATYAAAPYFTETTMQEIAIPLTATQADASTGGYTGLLFPASFTPAFYSTDGSGDYISEGAYTLAVVPEPAALGLMGVAAAGLLRRGHRAR
ncbi:MAG TPA: PEP-CTERM sorting domain-containing protein [Tepidisphaeraceae bacterium]|jgi:hypothetical protein|nr:PEP-CTERM sorting domain-containing protein [Tepidisphaeraceae bacterium]